MSAFGVDFGFDGGVIKPEIQYSLLGFSLDDLLSWGLEQGLQP